MWPPRRPHKFKPPPSDHTEKQAFSPHVADIIPLASELTIRLSSLESEIQDIPDPSKAAKKFEEIQAKTDEFVIEFQRLKDAKHSNSR
jgi:hypothetical protein